MQEKANIASEAVAPLHSERQRLENQRKDEGWDNIDAQLRSDRIAIQDKQNELATLAGQEGLPIPSFDAVVAEPSSSVDDLEMAIVETIKATEREIASLDSKLDLIADLSAQLQMQQEALDILLARKRVFTERGERYQGKKVLPYTLRRPSNGTASLQGRLTTPLLRRSLDAIASLQGWLTI